MKFKKVKYVCSIIIWILTVSSCTEEESEVPPSNTANNGNRSSDSDGVEGGDSDVRVNEDTEATEDKATNDEEKQNETYRTDNDEIDSVTDSAETDSPSGKKDTMEVNHDQSDTNELDAGYADDYESDAVNATDETDFYSLNDWKNCQLDCYKQGAVYADMCAEGEGTLCIPLGGIRCSDFAIDTPSSIRKPCENTCLKKVKSCLAKCDSSVDIGPKTDDSADCTLQCDEVELACNTMCSSYKIVDINRVCIDLCTEQKKTCESHC